jgi:aerotaxis receptor
MTMRDNQPVSQREFSYPQDYILVSITDADSRIRYCNPAFIEVSGFSEEELIGQPHNIVRHPDMPQEAFRDMWATIRNGEPWRGMVKNRRRNGDHYWVIANVTPIFEGGRLSGYMSVRTHPSAQQVREAEALYARMRAEKAQGRLSTRLEAGHLQRAGVLASLGRLAQLGVTGRIVGSLVFLGAAATAMDALIPVNTLAGLGARALVLTPLTAVLALWLHRTITVPLSEASAFARRVAACDLTGQHENTRRDEIGRLWVALSQVSVNLRGIVSDVRVSVGRVEQSAGELAGANQMFAARTESQASALQQSASSLEEMSSAVQNNADAAQQADTLATSANQLAFRGKQSVSDVVATMAEISSASKRISDIVALIDSIAFQTNILALNAAVEAARAGEQGRGFAVVASEVRALAQRSGTAARDIKSLIADSITRVETGSRGVDTASDRIGEIVGSVDKVSDLIRHIAQASVEQSNGVRQINQAVADLERTTQENSALVEQSSAAARGLADQASRLRGSVQIFRIAA